MKNSIETERYKQYSTFQLLSVYKEGYHRLRQVINNLSIDELKAKPVEGKWSILEIVIHLADAELVGACRMRLVLSDFKGSLPFYNQDDFAVKLKYNAQPENIMEKNLALFKALRETTYALMQQCTRQDWEKRGVHPERGEMTLRGLLELYADHSERHIEQIVRLRKLLNKPLEFEILLKDRLY